MSMFVARGGGEGALKAVSNSSWYGKASALFTATRGDGDAAGFTTGKEDLREQWLARPHRRMLQGI